MEPILFTDACAQGDIHITRVQNLPKGLAPVAPVNGNVIVTHSETGHHHVMSSDGVAMRADPKDAFTCYLYVEQPTELRHLRSFDTHAPILFSPGVYQVRRQREYVPEGFRRVED